MTAFLGGNPLSYEGVKPTNPPQVIVANRAVLSSDIGYDIGTIWINSSADDAWILTHLTGGTAHWSPIANGTTGPIFTITGDSGGAETATPGTGNFNLRGTANQITVTGTTHTETWSIPAVFIAPGSIAATTTVTAGTGITATTGNIVASTGNITATLGSVSAGTSVTAGTTVTATLGNITATNGNFVASTSGTGLLFNSPAASGVAASPVIVNGRSGQATFTTVSIAAAADLTLTITNSAITGATTQVIYSMSGATTGSALSIKSVTNTAGSSAIVVTNGTGATTSTADIVMNFLVVN